jgi:membrane protease YdiL (CAAX protease family)
MNRGAVDAEPDQDLGDEVREEPAAVAALTPEERSLRLRELVLVLSVAFLGSTFNSLVTWWNNEAVAPEDAVSSLYRILRAAVVISLLAYILSRRGWTLRTIGVTARGSDLSWTLAVLFCSKLVAGSIATLFVVYGVVPDHVPSAPSPGFLKWLAVLPSAAVEELIVRAYLMTELATLTGSMAVALIVSVGFQCFYHLYQGVPAALYHIGAFFTYAVFYAYKRRATPVVLAHALENFLILAR